MSNTSQSCTIKGYLCWWTCTLLKAFKYFSTSAWHILDREMLMHENTSCKELQTDTLSKKCKECLGKLCYKGGLTVSWSPLPTLLFVQSVLKKQYLSRIQYRPISWGGNACHFWQNHLRSEKDKPLTIYILHIQTTQGPNSVKSNIGSDHTTKAGKVFVFVAKKLYGRQGQPQLYIWNFWKTVTTYTLR